MFGLNDIWEKWHNLDSGGNLMCKFRKSNPFFDRSKTHEVIVIQSWNF
jgi:hypothetical protein